MHCLILKSIHLKFFFKRDQFHFFTKMQLANVGGLLRKSLTHQPKSLDIGDLESINEYTERLF